MNHHSARAAAFAVVAALLLSARLASPAGEAAPAKPAPRTRLPMVIRLVDPPIRDTLRWRCKPGYTMLRLKINARGFVAEAHVIEPFPVSLCVDSSDARRIDDLAAAVTRGWAFVPASTGGVPQTMLVDMPVYVPTDTLHVPRHDAGLIGYVVEDGTGAPMPGVRVEMIGSPIVTLTDRHGVFRVDNLVRMRAPVSFEHIRYRPDTLVAEIIPGRTDTLRLRMRRFPGVAPEPEH